MLLLLLLLLLFFNEFLGLPAELALSLSVDLIKVETLINTYGLMVTRNPASTS